MVHRVGLTLSDGREITLFNLDQNVIDVVIYSQGDKKLTEIHLSTGKTIQVTEGKVEVLAAIDKLAQLRNKE